MFEDLKRFISKIENFKQLKPYEKIDYFAFYLSIFRNENYFTPSQISDSFEFLRLEPHSNVSRYLTENSNKTSFRKRKIKYLKSKNGYHLEANFEDELRAKIKLDEEVPFIDYKLNVAELSWKPSDIPFTNNKIRKSAEFFTTLYFLFYHLENSIRKFLIQRLTSILGTLWELQLCERVDLSKAISIRNEVSLTEMLPERGENILYYCMWDDYAKIILQIPNIFKLPKERDEILAHLNSLAKIRNAIAHNASTIPKEYQDELTIFLIKYIKILKNNES